MFPLSLDGMLSVRRRITRRRAKAGPRLNRLLIGALVLNTFVWIGLIWLAIALFGRR